MIKVLLTGGLGNQMFQYAFGKALSLKHNTELVLSTSFLESKLPFNNLATQLKFELDVFTIKAKIEHNTISSKIFYPVAKAEYKLRDEINKIKYNVLIEKQHEFNSIYLQTPDNSYVKGNFQSERYFQEIEPVIRNEFSFKYQLDALNNSVLNQIQQSNAVSIHIRRGDYISLKQNINKFAQIPITYYQNAIRFITDKVENPVFFVFSDDINWVKDNLNTELPLTFITNNQTTETSYMDMQLMSLCKHNIICNSTFSWWAAWLNNNPQKLVIAPQNWFADVSINSQDIVPKEWIKL